MFEVREKGVPMLRERLNMWRTRFDTWWTQQPTATRALPAYLQRAFFNYLRFGSRQAAALSYFAIFSVFPLTLLLAVFISRLVGPVFAQQQIRLGLEAFLPPASTSTLDLLQTNLEQALQQGSQFTLIALGGLIWSGLGLFSNITSSLDFIFRVPASRSLWRERLVALGMAFALIALLVVSFATSAVLGLISAAALARPNVWIAIGASFLPLGLEMIFFALLFRFVPARRVHWDAVWPAAIFGAVGWEVLKAIFGWYLTNVANFQFVYGGLATAIVLLFWAYLIASIFLFSAELCAQLNEWLVDREWEKDTEHYLEGTARAKGE